MPNSDGDSLSSSSRLRRQALLGMLEQCGPVVRQRLAGRIPARFQAVLSLDDLMQQAYTEAFLHADEAVCRDVRAFTAWLTALARCNLADALRMLSAEKRGKGRRRVALPGGEDSLMALSEVLGTATSTPSRCAARRESCQALERALAELPELYQRVVRMYDLENRPVEEVANTLQRSPGAVYMMRARAHRRLRVLLGQSSKFLTSG